MFQQGEGVPSSRLVITANHGTELKRFLRGVHVVCFKKEIEEKECRTKII